eukprot:4262523-Lingulodinium_polyedra.AAC.1
MRAGQSAGPRTRARTGAHAAGRCAGRSAARGHSVCERCSPLAPELRSRGLSRRRSAANPATWSLQGCPNERTTA